MYFFVLSTFNQLNHLMLKLDLNGKVSDFFTIPDFRYIVVQKGYQIYIYNIIYLAGNK